jgi:hypothetical protein
VTTNADQVMRGQQPACGRQEHPVGGPKRRPPDLTAQHGYLVSEDNDFEVLRSGGAEPQEEQMQDALERDVKNGQNHDNSARSHTSLEGRTPLTFTNRDLVAPADLNHVRWVSHCRDLVQSRPPPDC